MQSDVTRFKGWWNRDIFLKSREKLWKIAFLEQKMTVQKLISCFSDIYFWKAHKFYFFVPFEVNLCDLLLQSYGKLSNENRANLARLGLICCAKTKMAQRFQYAPLRFQVHWLSVEFRIRFKICPLVFYSLPKAGKESMRWWCRVCVYVCVHVCLWQSL